MAVKDLARLRRSALTRDWTSRIKLEKKDFILPYFVVEGADIKEEIGSMPGVYHFSVDKLVEDISKCPELNAVLLFGVSDKKDDKASGAYAKDGAVQRAVKRLKKDFKDLIVITDVCLCPFTKHGHCGIIEKSKIKNQKLKISNEKTLKILARIAVSHAEAGADLVAPSAMMEGQVGAIRSALDRNGFKDTGILAYSAKYASAFYGPFRDALSSAPAFGDRRSYQMDFRNSNEALREIETDIKEGADIVMVKPALAYLDIIARARQNFNIPIAAYNVSGEYAMVEAYIEKSKIKNQKSKIRKEIVMEVLTSIKRAGADFIITYWGKEVIGWLKR